MYTYIYPVYICIFTYMFSMPCAVLGGTLLRAPAGQPRTTVTGQIEELTGHNSGKDDAFVRVARRTGFDNSSAGLPCQTNNLCFAERTTPTATEFRKVENAVIRTTYRTYT